jgi:hypothetical protein
MKVDIKMKDPAPCEEKCCCCKNNKAELQRLIHIISEVLWVLFFVALIFSNSTILILCLVILAVSFEEYS